MCDLILQVCFYCLFIFDSVLTDVRSLSYSAGGWFVLIHFDSHHNDLIYSALNHSLQAILLSVEHEKTNDTIYKGHSNMIWPHLTCSSFIIRRLSITQLLAQHIPLLGLYDTAVFLGASRWLHRTVSYGCCDTTHGQLPVQVLGHCWTPYPLKLSSACRCFLPTNCR